MALLSYDGRINFGLVGDFDLLWDLDDLAHDLRESLAELADDRRRGAAAPRSTRGV